MLPHQTVQTRWWGLDNLNPCPTAATKKVGLSGNQPSDRTMASVSSSTASGGTSPRRTASALTVASTSHQSCTLLAPDSTASTGERNRVPARNRSRASVQYALRRALLMPQAYRSRRTRRPNRHFSSCQRGRLKPEWRRPNTRSLNQSGRFHGQRRPTTDNHNANDRGSQERYGTTTCRVGCEPVLPFRQRNVRR